MDLRVAANHHDLGLCARNFLSLLLFVMGHASKVHSFGPVIETIASHTEAWLGFYWPYNRDTQSHPCLGLLNALLTIAVAPNYQGWCGRCLTCSVI